MEGRAGPSSTGYRRGCGATNGCSSSNWEGCGAGRPLSWRKEQPHRPQGQQYFRVASPSGFIISIPGSWFGNRLPPLIAGSLTCSGPMEDNPDVGTEVAEVMLICPVIWFMLFIPLVLVAMDTLMFMLLLYMLVLACCPKCGGDCCENMLFPPIFPCAHPFISVED